MYLYFVVVAVVVYILYLHINAFPVNNIFLMIKKIKNKVDIKIKMERVLLEYLKP